MARTRTEGGGTRSAPLPPRTSSSQQTSNTSGSRRAPRATVGAATHTNVGKSAENQDTFGVCSGGSSRNFAGVFDGHGEEGHKISQFACDALQRNLFSNSDLKKDPRSALDKAYRDTQAQIINEHGEDGLFSGTTAVAAYLNKDRLAVANVGDSRAVIGRCRTAASCCSDASLCAIDLSSDHKPDRKDEWSRVEKAGGKVGQSVFPMEDMFGAVKYVRAGPARVMGPDGLSGLAMSRSLGDAYLHPHVIAKPEIHERRLDSRDKLIILGSDGIWDVMESQEAVDIARCHKDPKAAARQIADISKKRWMAQYNNTVSDDITAVVMRLDHKEGGSSLGQRSDRPISGSKHADRASGHRRLEHRGGSSTGQRSDNPISAEKGSDQRGGSSTGQRLDHTTKASKNSDRKGGSSTGQRSDCPVSASKNSDRTSGQRNKGGKEASSVRSSGHRSAEVAAGARSHGQSNSRSQGHNQGHSHSSSHNHGHS